MSDNNSFNPFDPAGMFKELRSANMDAWAKMMVELVNTQAYADATGAMLDAWLSGSQPLRKAMETALTHTLATLKLPSRDEVGRLAERLENIEMRLDDLDAKLDDALRVRQPGGKPPAAKTQRSE